MTHDGSSRSKTRAATSTWKSGLLSEEGVYGVILVSGIIVATNVASDSSWHVFTVVISTVIVFWAAHVYAGTVAQHGHDDHAGSLPVAFREALGRSHGLLVASVPASIVLLLGALRAFDDDFTIWLALWINVAVLAVLGFVAFARRGAGLLGRLGGALLTAAFGVVVILLKAFIH
jgi:hypothetical protein